jgi:cytochrome c oxidase subunit 4
MMKDAHDYSEHAPAHHITKLPVYFGVFIVLMVGTIVTVAASRVDLGWMNTPIALTIAVIKATLVILFFMHLVYSTRLTWIVVLASLLWLSLLFVLTFADYLTRAWLLY